MSQPRTLPLAYDEESAFVARRFVRQFGAEHSLGSTEVQCLIASELVTNAVLHGGEPIELRLQYQDDELTVEVADSDPRIEDVRIRPVDEPRPGGRGLRIVASLATRWGARPFRDGKQVWAATDAPQA
jgi:anti-sigma regulatory factor (Ser/Thr protein kinase)